MKILVITNHSYMLYRFRRALLIRLMELGHEVVLSTPFVGHEEDLAALGARCIETEVDRRGINPVTDLKLLLTYRKLLRTEGPDLVLTYSIKPNIYAGLCCRMAKIPYCANVQGLGTAFQRKGLAAFVTVLYKTALKKAKTVFFENRGNAGEFTDRHIIPESRVTLLPGAGIDLAEYPFRAYPDNAVTRFLYLGRIMREKGMDELFDAMTRLRQKRSDVVLDLVGFFDDDYEARIRQLEADGIAVFHGFQTDPRPYYEAADCIVLPSWHEGMSNVLLEAAATGRPVITSDIFGCREAVEEGKTGLLCRVKDTDTLLEQMERFAQLPRSQRMDMGRAARAKTEREFEKDAVVRKTVDALLG